MPMDDFAKCLVLQCPNEILLDTKKKILTPQQQVFEACILSLNMYTGMQDRKGITRRKVGKKRKRRRRKLSNSHRLSVSEFNRSVYISKNYLLTQTLSCNIWLKSEN